MLHYRSNGYCYYFPTLGFRTREPNHGLGSPLQPNTVNSIPKPPFPSNHIEFKKETYHQIKWPYELQDKDPTHSPEAPPSLLPHFLTATRPEDHPQVHLSTIIKSISSHQPTQTLNKRKNIKSTMSFFAQAKGKVKKTLAKLSAPFIKKETFSKFRTPGRGGGTKLAKCLHCQSTWTRDPIQLCHDCKYFH